MTLCTDNYHHAVRLAIPVMNKRASINYKSESIDDYESSNRSIGSEKNIALKGLRHRFIIDKVNPNNESKIKEHPLSSNNLDRSLHNDHILNTLKKPTNKHKQTKTEKETETHTFQSNYLCQTSHSNRKKGKTVHESTGQIPS